MNAYEQVWGSAAAICIVCTWSNERDCRLQVTRERIRQIEAKAVRRLRVVHEARHGVIKDYADGNLTNKSLAAKAAGGLRKSS